MPVNGLESGQFINVVKIGGNVIDNPQALHSFIADFSKLQGLKVLVHGGGREATRLCGKLGIEAKMIDGRRVTDSDTLDVVTMIYAGLINKRVVALLQQNGCNAIGLTGADGLSISAAKRNPLPVDFGFVGDIDPDNVNAGFIAALLSARCVPVFCAICYDPDEKTLLNCNADSVASAVAFACSRIAPTRLTYCFEKPGVLVNPDDDDSVIKLVTPPVFERLKVDGVVSSGMLPKLQNALTAAELGVSEVRICAATALCDNSGTIIRMKQ